MLHTTVERTTGFTCEPAVGSPMLRRLGAVGFVGLAVAFLGLGVIAYADPMVATGLLAVLLGLVLVLKDVVGSVLSAMGFV